MVNRPVICLLLAFACLLASPLAHALLPRTQQDLRAAEDRLRYEFGNRNERRRDLPFKGEVSPILVAPPQAYWEESKSDFAPETWAMLDRVFPSAGTLVSCSQCFESRVFIANDSRMVIQNGELSLSDLARLRAQPTYKDAKSVLLIRETPSGVAIQLLAIDDGRILYTGVADSTKTLDQAEPPLHLARELDRRERGESLSYINLDLGIYPQALAEFKFLEQWGNHNQHLSGLAISAYNPTGAIGATYMYMLPSRRRMTLGLTGFYSVVGMFGGGTPDASSAFSAQAQFQYAFSGSYGVFVSGDTNGVISIGFSLLNPVLFPFLL